MKPAAGLKKAAVISAIVGSFSFYMYFKYHLVLGIFVGVAMGTTTLALLTTRRVERVSRTFLVTFSVLVWIGFFSLITWMGVGSLLKWVSIHLLVYYLPATISGRFIFPCTLYVPQTVLGTATYVPLGGFEVIYPSTIEGFMILMIPYILTALVFGRGFCGWMCCFGGVVEAFVTGTKERWKLSRFREKVTTTDGGVEAPAQLRDDVRDVKYGVLLGIILLSLGTAIPLVCMVCWGLWLNYTTIFWLIMGVFLIFVVVLPFMTKRRWFCLICPVGAVLNLLEWVNPFRIKIDENLCNKCMDCVYECRMYAMTVKTVEEAKTPNLDCIKCGRCIEVCPNEGAIDLYLRGTNIKVRTLFYPLAIAATAAWYVWFMVAIAMLMPRLLGLG